MTQPVEKSLWQPDLARVEQSRMTEFKQFIGFSGDYKALHQYSTEQPERFWSQIWDYSGVIGDKGPVALKNGDSMQGAKWFPQGELNFAENLLRYQDDKPAIIAQLENGKRSTLTYRELRRQVEGLACWFRACGLEPGDRVAALMPNVPETIVTMLAAASVGAIFSSCSPDFGASGVLDRFGQIEPKILVVCNGYYYNGKTQDIRGRLNEIVTEVSSIEQVLTVSVVPDMPIDLDLATDFDQACDVDPVDFYFSRQTFNHPLYIMYSSGTTGTPKCIVHSAGGILLQHLKEHQLHVNLRREDRLFYFTTCGWMMWNWLVSGLASGATIVLFDGSPFYPAPTAMLDLVEREKVSIFGTSAKFIASIEKEGLKPIETHDLTHLHTMLSTGSPLSHESFRYCYRDIKADMCLASISGGTDILSCFVLGNPTLPVHAGELQCAGLGMDVHIYNDAGNAVLEEKGELVCASPFPAMPVGFWNDQDGSRYHQAYFSRFDNVWAQGDYGEQTVNDGYIIHGRSDAVLNPGGVRIGTAEIYRQVQKVEQVIDSICVGQEQDDDVRVILFVVMREGDELDDVLRAEIRATIRQNTTPRHVPAEIISVPDIPRTISGKIVELAVRNVIHGRPVTNTDALANPEALEAFKGIL